MLMAETTPEQRLQELGLSLPLPAAGLGAYVPWAITGSLLMTSGQFPKRGGELAYRGRIGAELSEEQAYDACRLAALNCIAQMKEAVGSLSRIRRVVRLEGTVQVAPGFRNHPAALDGASDLVNAVFGERGRHTRMIYTNPDMPLDAPVLLVAMAEVEA